MSILTLISNILHCAYLSAWWFKSLTTDCFVNGLSEIQKIKTPHQLAFSEVNPSVNGDFPSQRASHAENASMASPIAHFVGPTLAQRGSCRLHVGPTWVQPALLSGMASSCGRNTASKGSVFLFQHMNKRISALWNPKHTIQQGQKETCLNIYHSCASYKIVKSAELPYSRYHTIRTRSVCWVSLRYDKRSMLILFDTFAICR